MTGPDPVAHPVTDPTTAAQDAQDALARLFARCAAIADDWEGPQPDKWRAMLTDTLAEPALQTDAARAAFEQQLVTALASGWRPGHDALFWVAPSAFGWDTDPATLLRHGAPGERLRLALAEQRTFDQQVDRLRFLQRYIAGRLRRPELPSDEELLYRVPHAVDMARRFPTWTATVTDLSALDRWTTRYVTLPKARALPAPGDTRPWSPDVESNRALVWIVIGTVILLSAIAILSRIGEKRGPPPRAQMSFSNTEPVTAHPASAPAVRPTEQGDD